MNSARSKLMAMLAMSAISSDMMCSEDKHEPTPEEIKEKENKIKRAKGQKPFMYGDYVIYALNRKNADRKARKLKLI